MPTPQQQEALYREGRIVLAVHAHTQDKSAAEEGAAAEGAAAAAAERPQRAPRKCSHSRRSL
jgi:hypothetical protein